MKKSETKIMKFLAIYVKIRMKREIENLRKNGITEKEYYTKKEVCSLLGISKSTLDRKINKGIIEPRHFGDGRKVNFLRKDITKIMGGN